MNKIRRENQMNSARLGLREHFTECAQRFGVRVPDRNGLAVFLRITDRQIELLANGLDITNVIKKRSTAERGAHTGCLCCMVCNCGATGPAVDEKQVALSEQ